MKFIVYAQENNQIAVASVIEELQEVIEDIVYKIVSLNAPYKIVESLDVDNTFFNAYEFDQSTGAIINMEKAKEIWKNKFRETRKPILEKLDVEYMRALENNDTEKQQEIASRKQQLRDVTAVELPDNLEDLKNTWPSILVTE
jgi:hypothetical protein